jgi:integrase
MASVRQFKNSQFWFACYSLPGGRRLQKSTKLTDRKAAQKIAEQLEDASRRKLSESQARRLLREICRDVHSIDLGGGIIRDFVQSWVRRKGLETSDQTVKKYSQVANGFLDFLGDKAGRELMDICSRDVTAYRDALAERLSPTTVNNALKVVRVILGDARREGLIESNPAEVVRTLSLKGQKSNRRGFTLEELKRLLEHCDDEWRALVVFGLYTGQRLGDLSRLTWSNMDLQREEIRLVTHKTGRQQIIPIASPLLRCIETVPVGDNPQQPVFPRAFGFVQKHGDTGYLSTMFNKVLVNAGMAQPNSKGVTSAEGKKTDRRILNALSFHSLRHTATSLLKNAGISPAIVQDIIGHQSAAVSANYTHIEENAKRKALEAMPDVMNVNKQQAPTTSTT